MLWQVEMAQNPVILAQTLGHLRWHDLIKCLICGATWQCDTWLAPGRFNGLGLHASVVFLRKLLHEPRETSADEAG